MAIIKPELRKHSVGIKQWPTNHRHALPTFDKQSRGPGVDVVDVALALHIVRIDTIMRLPSGSSPKLSKRIKSKREARMAGRHNAMSRKFIVRAEVAGETKLTAPFHVLGREQSGGQIGLVCNCGQVVMRRQPFLRAAVTGLAAHAVRKLKAFAALRIRNVVRVTVETDLRRGSRLQPQSGSNTL